MGKTVSSIIEAGLVLCGHMISSTCSLLSDASSEAPCRLQCFPPHFWTVPAIYKRHCLWTYAFVCMPIQTKYIKKQCFYFKKILISYNSINILFLWVIKSRPCKYSWLGWHTAGKLPILDLNPNFLVPKAILSPLMSFYLKGPQSIFGSEIVKLWLLVEGEL